MNAQDAKDCEAAQAALRQGAREIAARLRACGYQALWAGGCVRDLLMGRQPNDYDVATNATPQELLRLFPEAVPVGKAFGVVVVPWHGHNYELATFRADMGYSDGRRPDAVKFSDAQTDARRRDFTINALFMDPETLEVIDYVEGRRDIAARLIRCVGDADARFSEDHLRMLRAIRFAATLDFAVEEKTFAAIRRNAPKIQKISAERIQQELLRLLTESERPGSGIRLLDSSRLLEFILPEVAALKGQEQPPAFHPEGDVFTHTTLMLDAMGKGPSRLALACLLHDVGKPACAHKAEDRLRFHGHARKSAELAENILRRLKISNDDIKAITYIIENHMRFMDVTRMRRATLIRLTSEPTFPLELEMHRLDCIASHGDISNYEFLKQFVAQREAEPALPQPYVTGADILKMGIPEGPEVGKWKNKAFEAQLDGHFRDREHALEWLASAIKTGSGAAATDT